MGTFQIHSEQLELFRAAIRQRKQILAYYHGHHREFCFHILGLKGDVWHILGWQFGGSSESGKLPNWRCVALTELSDISMVDGTWHRGYTKGVGRQYCVDWVDTIVDPAYAAVIAA